MYRIVPHPVPEFQHIFELLQSGEWDVAALHIRHEAQNIKSRSLALQLWIVVERAPWDYLETKQRAEAMLWLAYRADKQERIEEILNYFFDDFAVFQIYLTVLQKNWQETLEWVSVASNYNVSEYEKLLVLRYQAIAKAHLDHDDWQQKYEEAIGIISSNKNYQRDCGLIMVDYAYCLMQHGFEEQARSVFSQAFHKFKQDAWLRTYIQVNLAFAWLRLGNTNVHQAEEAFRQAIKHAKDDARPLLSGAWRGLGGIYVLLHQFPRAYDALEQAIRTAETDLDRTLAMRGQAQSLRLQEKYDEALSILYDITYLLHLTPNTKHRIYGSIAALQIHIGDFKRAEQSLSLMAFEEPKDEAVAKILNAEMARQTGKLTEALLEPLRALSRRSWLEDEIKAFPELFELIGMQPEVIPWEAQVDTNGPIRLRINGHEVKALSPVKLSASLLAFLLHHQGTAHVERAIEGLKVAGKNVRAQHQNLSVAVCELREILGWKESISNIQGMLQLSREITWLPILYPTQENYDCFCEGRYDPWVLEWRSNTQQQLDSSYIRFFDMN